MISGAPLPNARKVIAAIFCDNFNSSAILVNEELKYLFAVFEIR